jgi:hypothetical protein
MPHYLGELMAFQVKQTSFLILLSMWVTVMLTIMSLGAALGEIWCLYVSGLIFDFHFLRLDF